jgi:hypothetical protein
MLSILGCWADPIDTSKHSKLVTSVVDRFDYRCLYCSLRATPTPNYPHGKLNICLADAKLSLESKNCISLCDFCVRLNSLENMKVQKVADKNIVIGSFVELPWIKQSQLNNLIRTAYCYEYLSRDDVAKEFLKNTPFLKNINGFIRKVTNTPDKWESMGFDGSAEKLDSTLKDFTGFSQNNQGVMYIDRLRFVFSEEYFSESISYWSDLIRQDVIAYLKKS